MKRDRRRRERSFTPFLIGLSAVLLGFTVFLFLSIPPLRTLLEEKWEGVTRGGRTLLGWRKPGPTPEEKRIRQEVIFRKMEEASASQDWKALVPEYPRPRRWDGVADEERMKVLRNSQEFREIEKSLRRYLEEKEDLLLPEPRLPSPKEAWELPPRRDRAAEKIVAGLSGSVEKAFPEKPLEENLQLGIRGPLAMRKILERPPPPPIKVRVETEIELIFWVLPNGMVDRAIPSVKGDAELERLAIQYMKQWRFAPLPQDQPQVEEWGTIPVRFKLQ